MRDKLKQKINKSNLEFRDKEIRLLYKVIVILVMIIGILGSVLWVS